ncbi:MAG: DUF1279 domain-containing protein [Myxococcota bacterium]|nr:DUF1279 domain-containing protein [Myxococcota bacterium]
MKNKVQELMALYGKLALIIYIVIFLVVLSVFYIAIEVGVDLESWSYFQGRLGQAGTLVVAWVATKITQPIRIAMTVALTPIVARFFGKKEREDGTEIST